MFARLLPNTVNASTHTKCASFSNQKCTTEPTHEMNKFKDYVYDYDYYPFVVNLIDVWEVVMVLMTYLIDHVLQIKLKI